MWNAKTSRLEPVQLGEREGAMASVTTSLTPPVIIPFTSKAVWKHGGTYIARFRAKSGQRGAVVFLYGATGGPPATIQTYLDHTLVSTNAYTWTRTTAGYVQSVSTLDIVRQNVLVGQVRTTVVPCRVNCPVGGAKLDRTASLTRALYRTLALGSSGASAQWYNMYWSQCAEEWSKYAADLAAFMAATVAMPESGPALVGAAAVVATLGNLVARDEQELEICMERQPDSWDLPSDDSLYPGGTGPSGAGSGAHTPQASCLEGSYAAHCQTVFTL